MGNIVTITDTEDVALMEIEDIRKWISLHQRSLKDETMKEYWRNIQHDLNILQSEFNLRNPIAVSLWEISKTLKDIHHELVHYIELMKLTIGTNQKKEKDHGKSCVH